MLDHEIVLKSFVNAGIPLALGSDGGVAEQNPFLNLMLAVLVPSDPSEALTRARTSAKDGLRLVLPPIWLCFLKTF